MHSQGRGQAGGGFGSNGIARRKRYLQCLARSKNESINYRFTVAISSQWVGGRIEVIKWRHPQETRRKDKVICDP
jgi:hypothetical protein